MAMMRACLVAFLMLGCGQLSGCRAHGDESPSGADVNTDNGTAANDQAAQVAAENGCVHLAMEQIYSDPRDNASVLARMNAADLTACPNDFSKAYVEARLTFGEAIDAAAAVSAHAQSQGDAAGAQVVVGLLEWASGKDAPSEPYDTWSSDDDRLKQTLNDKASRFQADIHDLQVVAADHGSTLQTLPVASTSDQPAASNAM
jgi:hypothetical protein